MPFALRDRLRWPGRRYVESTDERETAPTRRGRELSERYGLARYSDWMNRATLLESLGTLDLLDRLPAFGPHSAKAASSNMYPMLLLPNGAEKVRALDVGAKSWRYLPGLAAWAERAIPSGVQLSMTGLEIDAFRLYRDLRSRQSYGEFYARQCSSPRMRFEYAAGDAREWHAPVDLVTWLLPFVLPDPHEAWGLPLKAFDPTTAFESITRAVQPGGTLIMTNQDEPEWIEAQKLMPKRMKLVSETRVENSLHASHYPIFLTVWTREA